MKFKLLAAALVVSVFAVPAQAGTKEYIAICKNPKLSVAERASCRSEMLAAKTDFARTQIFRIYDWKTIGYNADGTREKPVQEAQAK